MSPEALERLRPFMERTNCFGVRSVKHVPPMTAYSYQTHVAQHSKMLRDRRLYHPGLRNQSSHRLLGEREVSQDLAPAWLRYRVESIGSSSCSCHDQNIYSYMGMCQGDSEGEIPRPCPAAA